MLCKAIVIIKSKYCRLNNSKKSNSTWFWKNEVNIIVTSNGKIHQILHTIDKEKLLGTENVDDFINNTSS